MALWCRSRGFRRLETSARCGVLASLTLRPPSPVCLRQRPLALHDRHQAASLHPPQATSGLRFRIAAGPGLDRGERRGVQVLSVDGQVRAVIAEAVNPSNQSDMYKWWMVWHPPTRRSTCSFCMSSVCSVACACLRGLTIARARPQPWY